jgi:DNA-binding XRE family transcriptional regulator
MSPAKAKAIFDFEALRKRLGFNQSEMASKMHMSPRTYFSLETDPEAISPGHVMIAQMVSLLRRAIGTIIRWRTRPRSRSPMTLFRCNGRNPGASLSEQHRCRMNPNATSRGCGRQETTSRPSAQTKPSQDGPAFRHVATH